MKKPKQSKRGRKHQKAAELSRPTQLPKIRAPVWKSGWRAVEICAAVAGILGFAYLLFDILYQASPEIEVVSSETASPFSLPFTVKTSSILFTMHRTSFTCSFDMDATRNNTFRAIKMQIGGELEIDRRNPGSYFCRNSIPASVVVSLRASISPKYCTNILFTYCWQRQAEPTFFTWIKTGQTGYWIKGRIGNL
jgi:hypothetical protein